ncbi:hypothetical protein B5V02_29930 [Mesorhizobium kowhaii]|uniref:Uncharacterized protein n=2 Tax=Mesorhizobium kowhaii TaxID=1300272 RepID=A0A2W7BVB6_9HYPH|nr:hypothetical protein B5V02_29930 [Mesorhizobium kowhaii]
MAVVKNLTFCPPLQALDTHHALRAAQKSVVRPHGPEATNRGSRATPPHHVVPCIDATRLGVELAARQNIIDETFKLDPGAEKRREALALVGTAERQCRREVKA